MTPREQAQQVARDAQQWVASLKRTPLSDRASLSQLVSALDLIERLAGSVADLSKATLTERDPVN